MLEATTVQAISTVKDVILAGAGVFGAVIAWRGLRTWNRQLKGSVEYELTRRLLKCTYRLREAIKGVRHPIMLASELELPDRPEPMPIAERRFLGRAKAYQARWEKVDTARNNLQTEMLEAEVVWGKTIYAKFEPLFKLQHELFSDVQSYLGITNPDEGIISKDAWRKIRASRREVLYDMLGSRPDPYSDDIAKAISEIESYLKPHLVK